MRWNLFTPWHSTLLAHNNGEEPMPKAKVGQAPPCPWLPPSRGKLQFMAVGTVTNTQEPSVEWIEGAFREPHVLTALLVQLRTRWWASYHRGDSAATVAFRLHATTRWSQSYRIAVFNESFVGNAECLELEVDRHLLELAFPTTPGLAPLPSAQQQLNRQSDQVSVFRQMVYSKFLLSHFRLFRGNKHYLIVDCMLWAKAVSTLSPGGHLRHCAMFVPTLKTLPQLPYLLGGEVAVRVLKHQLTIRSQQGGHHYPQRSLICGEIPPLPLSESGHHRKLPLPLPLQHLRFARLSEFHHSLFLVSSDTAAPLDSCNSIPLLGPRRSLSIRFEKERNINRPFRQIRQSLI